MGVDLGTYRQRIGSFLMPFKTSKTSRTLTIPLAVRIRFLITLKLVTCLTALLLTYGDIETNPGPSTESRTYGFSPGHEIELTANLHTLSNKIDEISSSINELKMENELLREENIKMKEKLDRLYSKVDNLEGHSRRNNLKFSGISGQINEPWDEIEKKIRDFIETELDRPDLEHVDIERVHRVKSKDS